MQQHVKWEDRQLTLQPLCSATYLLADWPGMYLVYVGR